MTGNVYKVRLGFEMGFAYAQVVEFSGVEFDGRLLYILSSSDDLDSPCSDLDEELEGAFVELGPFFMSEWPRVARQSPWRMLGCASMIAPSAWPPTKRSRRSVSLLTGDWSLVPDWYAVAGVGLETAARQVSSYEEVRSLETRILQTPSGVRDKATMYRMIQSGMNVQDAFELRDRRVKNLYEQLVNTYFSAKDAGALLSVIFDEAA